MKYPRDGWLSHHEAEILESEVPEFFSTSWEEDKNNEKLLIIYLWQAVTAGGHKPYIDDQINGARECAKTLTDETIKQCKETVLRMMSRRSKYA